MIPSIEWFNKLPKLIDNNGCWISRYAIRKDGYVRFRYKGEVLLLHRASLSAYHKIDYFNYEIETRHSEKCNKACFNPEHLKSGSHYENIRDSKILGKYIKIRGERCPKCNSKYTTVINKAGEARGKSQQYCKVCFNVRRRAKYVPVNKRLVL